MIRQLRPFYSAEELPGIYDHVYDHTLWEDHKIRVATTIHIGRWLRDHIGAQNAADLSCGDGAILRGLDISESVYGDLVPATHLNKAGPILETLEEISPVDLFVLSETLEHVEGPRTLLSEIRKKASALVLSTPEGEEGTENPEHYWGWDRHDIRGMLKSVGWEPVVCTILNTTVPSGYTYQIWGCV